MKLVNIWHWLSNPANRGRVALIAAVIFSMVGGLWAFYIHFSGHKQQPIHKPQLTIEQNISGGSTGGVNTRTGSVNITNMVTKLGSEEKEYLLNYLRLLYLETFDTQGMAKKGISSDDIVMRKTSGVSVISISDKFKQITNDFNEVLYNFVSSYSNDKKFTIIKPIGFDEAQGIIKDAHITLTDSGYIALKELEQGLNLSDNQNNSINVNINNPPRQLH